MLNDRGRSDSRYAVVALLVALLLPVVASASRVTFPMRVSGPEGDGTNTRKLLQAIVRCDRSCNFRISVESDPTDAVLLGSSAQGANGPTAAVDAEGRINTSSNESYKMIYLWLEFRGDTEVEPDEIILLRVKELNSSYDEVLRAGTIINDDVDLDVLAARGGELAAADSALSELRGRVSEAGRRGFDIGLAAAEGHSEPGPGKDKIRATLNRNEQVGFSRAVAYTVERNRNAVLISNGVRIAESDAEVAELRNAEDDAFYRLGFDVATGIFGDPAQGARGNTATGPGSLKIRDGLSAAGQRGFDASVTLHLSRTYRR